MPALPPVNHWVAEANRLKLMAKERLDTLEKEKEDIYQAFPDLRPAPLPSKRAKVHNGTHWTQKPENRSRMLANIAAANAARE